MLSVALAPAVSAARVAKAPAEDPLELLWAHRVTFGPGGEPRVTIRVLEADREIELRPGARGRLRLRRGSTVAVAPGQRLRIRLRPVAAARLAHHPLLGEAAHRDAALLDPVRRRWEERGVTIRQRVTGAVYGIGGRVVDNRRVLLVAQGDGTERAARAFADDALARDGARTGTFTEVVSRPSARLEVRDRRGRLVGTADSLATLDLPPGARATLSPGDRNGAAPQRAEERAFRGRIHLTVGTSGRLVAVLSVGLEELLRGLVPSEMPASAPREALRAQAVTARSNVLAQLGTRHLDEPYVLCSEVHCQAYRGDAERTAATDAAVRSTAGEALFRGVDGLLVDAVYSALCGGHGEDNDAVWPTLPDPSLRGGIDGDPAETARWRGGLADEERLRAFLSAGRVGWCGRAVAVPRDRHRWERRLGPAELGSLGAQLGIGPARTLEVTARGVSGRARSLVVTGEVDRTVVEGELRIRRLLANLPSSMFVIDREGSALILRGGGWGHGVGMCQWGAIARAEAGQDHRAILRAYYAGAEAEKIY